MARRCYNGHLLPEGAALCPRCWQVEKHKNKETFYRVPRRLRLWLALGVLLVLGVVFAMISSRREIATHIALAERYQDAVFKIIASDSAGGGGQGSGVLLDSTGLALTAFHVLRGGDRIRAEFQGGRIFEATGIVAWDSVADVAVFRLGRESAEGVMHPRAHAYPSLRQKLDLETGARVVAIGAPEGLANTISEGIVSAMRDEDGARIVQVTAPISHGSSGGPMFDSQGRMIGVARSKQIDGEAINFVSPITMVPAMLAETTIVAVADFAARTRELVEVETFQARLYRLAGEEGDDGRDENAVKLYNQILEDEPEFADAHYMIAFRLRKLGRPADALAHIEKYLELNHEDDKYQRYASELREDLLVLLGRKPQSSEAQPSQE